MFSKKTIMEMMRTGKTAEDIANEFAATLNEAEAETKRIDEEARAKADAEALLATRKAEKIEDMRYLINAIFDYLHEWYPELKETLDESIKNIDDDEEIADVVDLIDSYINLAKSMKTFESLFGPNPFTFNHTLDKSTDNSKNIEKISVKIDPAVNLNKIFEDFFTENNI